MNRNAIILPFLTAVVLFAGNISSKPEATTSSSRETAVEHQAYSLYIPIGVLPVGSAMLVTGHLMICFSTISATVLLSFL